MLDFLYGVVLLFEVVLSIIIGIFIIRRDRTQLLNQVFLLVMFAFAGYLFFESIIYLVNINDLPTIDLLRDISVIFSTTAAALLVLSALIVQYGEVIIQRKIYPIIALLAVVVLVIIGVPFDSADTSISDTYVIFKQADILGTIALLFVPMLGIFFAMFQYLRIRQSSQDTVLRQKLLRLSLGLLLITVGIAYFAVFPEFRYPGHISYIAGLLSLFWAFK
ncbi:MAG: hypothetical protein ACFFC6_01075 [Promethearchaeota archaeon]